MKRFIGKILLYSSPFLLLFAAMLCYNTRVDEQKLASAYAGEIAAYGWAEHCGPVEGMILGSSSLKYGLSANGISDTGKQWVNFSNDARDPVVMYLLLKNYYEALRPRSVIIGLDPWIYARDYYVFRNKIMYLDLNGNELLWFLKEDVNAIIGKSQVFAKMVAGRYNNRVVAKSAGPVPADFGSVKLEKKAQNFEADKEWIDLEGTGWSDVQFEYLAKLHAFCKAHNINAVYVFPPKRADYVSAANGRFKKENTEWWRKVCDVLPDAKLLGTFDQLKNYEQEQIFADAYHLNPKGQDAYSAYIKGHLNEAKMLSPDYSFISE